jgi:hypothetical protein
MNGEIILAIIGIDSNSKKFLVSHIKCLLGSNVIGRFFLLEEDMFLLFRSKTILPLVKIIFHTLNTIFKIDV